MVKREKREKKIRIPEPEKFDGTLDANPSYQRWYEKMNDYLNHNRGKWDDDSDLIRILGAFLTGRARDWFDQRARRLRNNRQNDKFGAFVSAMDERYKVDFEVKVNYKKLFQVKYTGNILQYLDKLEGLNEKVGIAGITWREVIKDGLPHELRKELAKVKGGEPEEDDALMGALKEIGLAHEKFLAEEKVRGNSGGGQDSGAKGKGKGKRKRGSEKDNDAQEKEDTPAVKKPKGAQTPAAGKSTPRFTKEQESEALKGIPQNLREARMNKGLCTRCGLPKHRWQWCRKEISISSTRKKGKKEKKDGGAEGKKDESAPAASSIQLKKRPLLSVQADEKRERERKRKTPVNTTSVSIHPLPVEERILANLRLKAGDSKRVRTASGVKSEEQRLWEIDSEDEGNM